MRLIIVIICLTFLSELTYAQDRKDLKEIDFGVHLADSIDKGHVFVIDVTRMGCFGGTDFVLHIRKIGSDYFASQSAVGYDGGEAAVDTAAYRLRPSQIDSLKALELELIQRFEEVRRNGDKTPSCATITEHRIYVGWQFKRFTEPNCTTWLRRLMAAMRRL
ncbi:hypothetical protein [Flaviaesturariibacter amylovorans]|uniref:Uncharacterized protein n=1 Tax=Flaviaesturariibacter amylovorans TaxID=1084520 RepID=A0ABP8G3Y6_9BACT